MTISPTEWFIWAVAMGALASLWFVPNLPGVWAGVAMVVVSGYLYFLGDRSWVTFGFGALGICLISYWAVGNWRDRRRPKPSNPTSETDARKNNARGSP